MTGGVGGGGGECKPGSFKKNVYDENLPVWICRTTVGVETVETQWKSDGNKR